MSSRIVNRVLGRRPAQALQYEGQDLTSATGVVLDWGMRSTALDVLVANMPQLRWVHVMSTGVDHLPIEALAARRLVITSGKGLRTRAVAEYVTGLLYLGAKKYLQHRQGDAGRVLWSQPIGDALVCILGTGSIGQSIAELLEKQGMRIRGVSRSGEPRSHFDRVYPVEQAHMALAGSNFVVICLPLTPGTHGFVTRELLSLVADEAYLVNVGRDALVDGCALRDLVSSGKLSGAALDIDPPRSQHPCRGINRVLFTNHSAFALPGDEEQMTERLVQNVHRFLENRPLLGEINGRLGY